MPKATTTGKWQSLGFECNQPSSKVHTDYFSLKGWVLKFSQPCRALPRNPLLSFASLHGCDLAREPTSLFRTPIPPLSGRYSLRPAPLPLLSHINPMQPRSFFTGVADMPLSPPPASRHFLSLNPRVELSCFFFLAMKFT